METRARAVLFDLDGTLLDSLQDLATSMNLTLSTHGFPAHPVAAYRYFVGEGVDELARHAAPAGTDPATRKALVVEMRAHYQQTWARCTRPYAGIPELLDELTSRGLVLAVLSNKPEDLARLMVSQLLPRWRFAAVVGASPRFPRKPDPSSAKAIAAELELAAGDFFYLGDSAVDMRTAVGAGMRPAGALWGFRDADELRAGGARWLLDAPLELISLVDGES
jgi:phosphoglycolate phosphatase